MIPSTPIDPIPHPCLTAWQAAIKQNRAPAAMKHYERQVAQELAADEPEALGRARALVCESVRRNTPQRGLAVPVVRSCLRRCSPKFVSAEKIAARVDYVDSIAHQMAQAADQGMACVGPLQGFQTLQENAKKFKRALNSAQFSFLESIAYAEALSADELRVLRDSVAAQGPLITRFFAKCDESIRAVQIVMYEAIFGGSSDVAESKLEGCDPEQLATTRAILEHVNTVKLPAEDLSREEACLTDLMSERVAASLVSSFSAEELVTLKEHVCTDAFAAMLRTQQDLEQDHLGMMQLPHILREIEAANAAQGGFLSGGHEYE